MAEQAPVEGREHWTKKGDVRLFLWEKAAVTPQKRGTVLFVHGSSMASQPTFDLKVEGRPDSSVMDWFARRGFDCWCVDMEGYGRSHKDRDNNAPSRKARTIASQPPLTFSGSVASGPFSSTEFHRAHCARS